MTDETDISEEEAPATEPQGPLAGERLAEARRERQISVVEIAKELHIDEHKVRALENNEFDVLGAPVFAKGHLRKYSQLVGVNHEDVVTDYYRLTRSQSMPPVVPSRSKPQRDLPPGVWTAGVVVILVVAIAYWFTIREPSATEESVSQVPTPAAVEASVDNQAATGDADPDEAAAADETVVADEPAAAVPEAAQPPASLPQESPLMGVVESRPLATVADGDVRLSITFLGDCWTEVYDATGERLYFGMGRTGRTVNVSGPAPLSVLVGDADNVSLRVDGNDFAIADADRRGRTARLMLHGS